MALAAGTRFGPYEIADQIGKGGMGEVYRATDTKLRREVAIKMLPAALANDTDRLARFEREAKLLASLNHANIAAIYGFDEHEGTLYLAMELVEGKTLEEKLKPGALPVEDALRLALQIAQALEAAHDKGVIHRDLKPANIMVNTQGQVKVLDFGLAKAFGNEPAEASPGQSPALSLAMTQQGMILGTAGYMSPEQASGQATDQRADIWAFGVVLYEMLTGLPLFSGESVPHILADVLKTEPDWKRLPKNLHPRLIQLLQRCLRKKPRVRYHAIADARVDIEEVLSDPAGVAPARAVQAGTAPVSGFRRFGLPAGLMVVAAALAIPAVRHLRETPDRPVESQRLSMVVPANRPVDISGYPTRSLALSPDGAQLVYVGVDRDAPDGQRPAQLELRSLGTLAIRDLPGTSGARQPFFSPDGQWVGFFTRSGELKKVSLGGGNPITLLRDINGSAWSFGAWSDDGTIIFGTVTGGLRRISADGGAVSDLTTLEAGGEQFHSAPALVPSGRAVLFYVRARDQSVRIEALMLDSGERHVVVEGGRYPVVLSNGRLLFQRGEAILVAPFDTEQIRVTGSAVPLTDNIRDDGHAPDLSAAELAVSSNGTLAYLPTVEGENSLGLVTLDGSFEPLGVPSGYYELPRVSPDGRSIAFIEAREQRQGVRIYDLARGTSTNLRGGGACFRTCVASRRTLIGRRGPTRGHFPERARRYEQIARATAA